MLKRSSLQFGHTLALAALASAALFMTAHRANAADPSPAEAQSFAALDINHDGFIDKREAVASPHLAKVFDAADTNRDGRLSPQEYAKASSLTP